MRQSVVIAACVVLAIGISDATAVPRYPARVEAVIADALLEVTSSDGRKGPAVVVDHGSPMILAGRRMENVTVHLPGGHAEKAEELHETGWRPFLRDYEWTTEALPRARTPKDWPVSAVAMWRQGGIRRLEVEIRAALRTTLVIADAEVPAGAVILDTEGAVLAVVQGRHERLGVLLATVLATSIHESSSTLKWMPDAPAPPVARQRIDLAALHLADNMINVLADGETVAIGIEWFQRRDGSQAIMVPPVVKEVCEKKTCELRRAVDGASDTYAPGTMTFHDGYARRVAGIIYSTKLAREKSGVIGFTACRQAPIYRRVLVGQPSGSLVGFVTRPNGGAMELDLPPTVTAGPVVDADNGRLLGMLLLAGRGAEVPLSVCENLNDEWFMEEAIK